jgi:hypothetical protein
MVFLVVFWLRQAFPKETIIFLKILCYELFVHGLYLRTTEVFELIFRFFIF